ncbi:unnamed protein product [Prunus armeniaca]
MSYTRRLLERQERENEERMRKRVEEEREWEDDDDHVAMAMTIFHQSSQGHRGSQVGCGLNLGNSGSRCILSFDTWVWHAFFGVAGSQNNLNVLGQSPVFNDVLRGQAPQITYEINNIVYSSGYHLAYGIYPRWTTFGYRNNVERCFGILQAQWSIIRVAACLFDEDVLRSIMITCIILHNMIVEDEYDYDELEMFEPDTMNTTLTRIYEWPVGENEQLLEHEPLIRDGHYNNSMIDRYTEMQYSYIHKRRQVDLIEHLWALRDNHCQ